jgi:hypothetical protein
VPKCKNLEEGKVHWFQCSRKEVSRVLCGHSRCLRALGHHGLEGKKGNNRKDLEDKPKTSSTAPCPAKFSEDMPICLGLSELGPPLRVRDSGQGDMALSS